MEICPFSPIFLPYTGTDGLRLEMDCHASLTFIATLSLGVLCLFLTSVALFPPAGFRHDTESDLQKLAKLVEGTAGVQARNSLPLCS